MPVIGFKEQFAGKVESGEKRQTIRSYRKDGRDPKPGDRLYLYTGLRTKGCRKLGEAVCQSVTPIRIERYRPRRMWSPRLRIFLRGSRGAWRRLPVWAVVALVLDDGFCEITDFLLFFESSHGLPFNGLLIKWGDIER